jgi:hypothetical protein
MALRRFLFKAELLKCEPSQGFLIGTVNFLARRCIYTSASSPLRLERNLARDAAEDGHKNDSG